MIGNGIAGRVAALHQTGRGLVLASLIVAAFTLASCEQRVDVSALNSCGHPVQVNVGEAGWNALGPGTRRTVAMTGDGTRHLRVEVRRNDASATKEFTVPMATLPPPPGGVDADVEVILEGERCPPAE